MERGALRLLAEEAEGRPLALLCADVALRGSDLAERAQQALARAARVEVTWLTARESRKTLRSCEAAWRAWSLVGAGRDALAVALGGGIVSDVAGLAAACWHRGVPWVVAPTTTLAMADAALGGKVAVNTPAGKNLVGAVHHPRAVLADLDALDTLPRAAFVEGLAEAVKAAVVGDAGLLDVMERSAGPLRDGDVSAAAPVLERALLVKASVVEADAVEAGRREILNFGHTVAHAMEHASRHALGHGRAVAAGMACEARLAESMGRLPPGTARRITALCDALGIRRARAQDPAALEAAMRRDKKARAGVVRVALPDGLGAHGEGPCVEVEPSLLIASMRQP